MEAAGSPRRQVRPLRLPPAPVQAQGLRRRLPRGHRQHHGGLPRRRSAGHLPRLRSALGEQAPALPRDLPAALRRHASDGGGRRRQEEEEGGQGGRWEARGEEGGGARVRRAPPDDVSAVGEKGVASRGRQDPSGATLSVAVALLRFWGDVKHSKQRGIPEQHTLEQIHVNDTKPTAAYAR